MPTQITPGIKPVSHLIMTTEHGTAHAGSYDDFRDDNFKEEIYDRADFIIGPEQGVMDNLTLTPAAKNLGPVAIGNHVEKATDEEDLIAVRTGKNRPDKVYDMHRRHKVPKHHK